MGVEKRKHVYVKHLSFEVNVYNLFLSLLFESGIFVVAAAGLDKILKHSIYRREAFLTKRNMIDH